MTSGSADAPRGKRPEGSDGQDPSTGSGLTNPVPTPRTQAHGSRRVGPLDMSQDPDRFDPTRPAVPPGPLDMSQDPDRFDAGESIHVSGPLGQAGDSPRIPHPGEGQSLTDLVGKRGAHEDERDNYTWALGLLGVLAFLGVVAYLFGEVLTP